MTIWSRRGVIASAGTLAMVGGANAHTSKASGVREVQLLRTYIAGADRRTLHDLPQALGPGMPLCLVREPRNDFDTRAVAVWTECGLKLGYVPRIENQPLTNLIDVGIQPRVAVHSVRADQPRPRINIDISLFLT